MCARRTNDHWATRFGKDETENEMEEGLEKSKGRRIEKGIETVRGRAGKRGRRDLMTNDEWRKRRAPRETGGKKNDG